MSKTKTAVTYEKLQQAIVEAAFEGWLKTYGRADPRQPNAIYNDIRAAFEAGYNAGSAEVGSC